MDMYMFVGVVGLCSTDRRMDRRRWRRWQRREMLRDLRIVSGKLVGGVHGSSIGEDRETQRLAPRAQRRAARREHLHHAHVLAQCHAVAALHVATGKATSLSHSASSSSLCPKPPSITIAHATAIACAPVIVATLGAAAPHSDAKSSGVPEPVSAYCAFERAKRAAFARAPRRRRYT